MEGSYIAIYADNLWITEAKGRGNLKGSCVGPDNNEEIQANANLIAAAPDLLKEMERMLVVIQRIEDELPATWAEATQGTGIATSNGYRVAIAKAKGIQT